MVPAKAPTKAAVAKVEQRRLITILKDDHNFDVVDFIVKEMGFIQRSKKIKPLEKRRLLKDYSLSLLSYCMPKMKIVEDDSNKNRTPINFQINIGDAPPVKRGPGRPPGSKSKSKGKGGVSVNINTKKNSDGTYVIDDD